jgi:hypothetical protein
MSTTSVKRTIAIALSGAALAGTVGAPAASATPNLPPDPVGEPSPADATPDAGLDLSSAAIGAASGTGLLIVVLAAGGLAWRRPVTRRQGATRA